jgi:AcrR family transcriptional regulator
LEAERTGLLRGESLVRTSLFPAHDALDIQACASSGGGRSGGWIKAMIDPDGRPASARRRILSAAQDLLREESLSQLSMERVAVRAGLTRRTVYNQFDDRDALYLASRMALLEAFEFDLPGEVPPARDPVTSLEAFFREALEVFTRAEHVELQASVSRDALDAPWLARTYQLRVERPLRITLESWLLSEENQARLPPADARALAHDGVEMLKSATWRSAQSAFTCRELALVFVDRLRSRQAALSSGDGSASATRAPGTTPGLL